MRREFLKSDFHNAATEKPVEFEIKDYDEALKNSEYPQKKNQTPEPQTATAPAETPQEPTIKQEPVEVDTPTTITPPTTQEIPLPTTPKIPAAVRRLQSNLDGQAWGCSDTHGPRLRVRTTGVEEEEEYLDSWNNIVPAHEHEQPKED